MQHPDKIKIKRRKKRALVKTRSTSCARVRKAIHHHNFLQLWQSLSCASIVIVGQRDQKERSGTMETKAHQTKQNPKTPKNQSLTNRVKGETMWMVRSQRITNNFGRKAIGFFLVFSCIAERARDIVGQLLEIRNEVKPN